MLVPLAIGCITLFVTMGIQVAAIVTMLRYLRKRLAAGRLEPGFALDVGVLMTVMGGLFLGHLIQISLWAVLILTVGQMGDGFGPSFIEAGGGFSTAFYHSTVNFTSLGYGDLVLEGRWRLLGALEAASGVLMFGLSTGTIMSVMSWMFRRHGESMTASDTQE